MSPVGSFLILGGGSAGFLAALTLRVRFPKIPITLLRSSELGIIGVGEGTFAFVPHHLHGYLGIDPAEFLRETRPTWKLGTRFLWGTRDHFNYTFDNQTDHRLPVLPRLNGYYCQEDFSHASVHASLMAAGKAFRRQPDGSPLVDHAFGYHIENEHFVSYLEKRALSKGIIIEDGTVASVAQDQHGVKALHLKDGRTFAADFFVDCSGFSSLLLEKTLGTEFVSFDRTLYCDRAVVGGWERRADEPILPYTTSETMEAGWCWKIEHPSRIVRGYVYGSAFLSDEAADAELRRKNPQIKDTRVVRFRSGIHRRCWVKNVMAIGNASGFVEPLEATAIAAVCSQSKGLADILHFNDLHINDTLRDGLNAIVEDAWLNIREFLGVHYRFNHRLKTPFWKACVNEVDIGSAAAIVEYYKANGPNSILRHVLERRQEMFSLEGYYTMLIGLGVLPDRQPEVHPRELLHWKRFQEENRREGERGLSVAESLAIISLPQWSWNPDFYGPFRPA